LSEALIDEEMAPTRWVPDWAPSYSKNSKWFAAEERGFHR
jgi:hypothetical protein